MATSPKLTPRLRASCDGCYTAKIKCTKERPTCSRCKSIGLVCNYSPSQRAGGRSREVRARHESSLISQAPDRTPQNLSNQASPILPIGRQSQTFGSTTFQTSDGFHPLWSDPTISGCPGSANMLGDFDDDLLKPWRDYLPTPEEQSSTFNMSEELVTYTDNATSHVVQPELIPTPPPSSHDNVRACDCFLSMVQALNTIGNQSKTTGTPPLETVLSASKDVIARGEAVLHCTCSDDSALIMLLTGLISKHLSFYLCSVNGFASSPSSSSSSAGENNCSLPSSRVTVGKYMMDGDDEERLRIEIMMMELQKMGTLVMRFRGKFASLPVGYEGHTNETVLNFLNTRLREATDGLQREKQRLKGEP